MFTPNAAPIAKTIPPMKNGSNPAGAPLISFYKPVHKLLFLLVVLIGNGSDEKKEK